jgi:hypothetical protein
MRSVPNAIDAIVDEDTGKEVGMIRLGAHPRGRHVSLFDGKYKGNFESHAECEAFVKGVEAVLNHVVAVAA